MYTPVSKGINPMSSIVLTKTAHLSNVLCKNKGLTRLTFDPTNTHHRTIFAKFLMGQGWCDGFTFHIQAPHTTVPATCTNALLNHALQAELNIISK